MLLYCGTAVLTHLVPPLSCLSWVSTFRFGISQKLTIRLTKKTLFDIECGLFRYKGSTQRVLLFRFDRYTGLLRRHDERRSRLTHASVWQRPIGSKSSISTRPQSQQDFVSRAPACLTITSYHTRHMCKCFPSGGRSSDTIGGLAPPIRVDRNMSVVVQPKRPVLQPQSVHARATLTIGFGRTQSSRRHTTQ